MKKEESKFSVKELGLSEIKIEDYEVLAKVGEGTFGDVFQARKSGEEKRVALKLLKESVKNGVSVALDREIKFLRRLRDCENIVRLEDVFVHEEKLVVSFEYVENDLSAMLKSMGSFVLEERFVKTLFFQLLIGLNECHSRGIMHRDLKSANLLINSEAFLKIGDFGMASDCKKAREHDHNVVTLWYRAPELLMGERFYGPEIDIWSAGVVFAEMIIGQPPFRTTRHSVREQIANIVSAIGKWEMPKEYPEYKHFEQIFTNFVGNPRFYEAMRTRVTPLGLQFLKRMLDPIPQNRITIEEAIQHEYWDSAPLPAPRSEFPKHLLTESHSYQVTGGRQRHLPKKAAKIKPPARGELTASWGLPEKKKQRK